MKVKIKKLRPDAIVPTYATNGSACFDLYASDEVLYEVLRGPFPSSPLIVNTGLCFEIPEGYFMQILSRSGLAFNHGYTVFPGVIDSDYRGAVMVKMMGENFGGPRIRNGDRIAQAIILPVIRIAFEETDEVSGTERGTGGFGSTGL